MVETEKDYIDIGHRRWVKDPWGDHSYSMRINGDPCYLNRIESIDECRHDKWQWIVYLPYNVIKSDNIWFDTIEEAESDLIDALTHGLRGRYERIHI